MKKILLVTVLIFLAAACGKQQRVQPQDTPDNISQRSDWLTYSDSKYGFSLQYPPKYNLKKTNDTITAPSDTGEVKQTYIADLVDPLDNATVLVGIMFVDKDFKSSATKVVIGNNTFYNHNQLSPEKTSYADNYAINLNGKTLVISFFRKVSDSAMAELEKEILQTLIITPKS